MSKKLSPEAFNRFKDIIRSTLETRGFTSTDYTAISTRDFASVVGRKQAHVYLWGNGIENSHLFLEGDMLSEGNNCLALCTAYIPKTATDDEIRILANKFSDSVEKAVSQLTVVKLLRHVQSDTALPA